MASIPLATGAFKTDGNNVPGSSTNKSALCCADMADQNTGIAVWCDHSQVVGEQAQQRETQPDIWQRQRHQHSSNPQRVQQRERLSRQPDAAVADICRCRRYVTELAEFVGYRGGAVVVF